MEPRPHERGKELLEKRDAKWNESFNGATSSRTWKAEGEGFTTRQDAASMEPRPHERGKPAFTPDDFFSIECFNGATSSRTWKESVTELPAGIAPAASMEPRPHERGKLGFARNLCRVPGFNGATSSRTWKARTQLDLRFRSQRFNGATSSRTWKVTRFGVASFAR